MIDTGKIVLRRRGEQGSNVSKNPLLEHKDIVETIPLDEEFEEPAQYIVDETKIVGITEKPFILEEEPSEVGNIKEPFIVDLHILNLLYLNFQNNHCS